MNNLIEEIKRQRKFANDDLSDATNRTLNSRKGRKQNAIFKLEELFFDFRNLTRKKVSPIIVFGSETDSFANIAAESVDLLNVEANVLYDVLASMIDPKLISGKEKSAVILDVLSKYLEDIAKDIGIASYPQLVYSQKYDGKVSSVQEASSLIKRAIKDAMGNDMACLYIIDQVVKVAYNNGDFDSKFYPILIKVRSEESLKDLFLGLKSLGTNAITIAAGETNLASDMKLEKVNEKTVLDILKKTKKKINNPNLKKE